MDQAGSWLSILDYAKLKKTSISTIRRHIKSKKIVSKLEDGKYLIFVDQKDQLLANNSEDLKSRLEIELLKAKLRELQEENNDLKMLVTLYEGANRSAVDQASSRVPLA